MLFIGDWSNASATGYMIYALRHYNTCVIDMNDDGKNRDGYRELAEEEMNFIIRCVNYAFDMKTLEEASAIYEKW